ncbi:MAG: DegV family protein [Clostridia bacterium]|nr:DegV family protein [Clostridia bacterium]
MKIRITADSTCDLSEELITKYNVGIVPLTVLLGEQSFRDGVNIVPQDIFDYVAKTGILPKTSAPSIADYEEFFEYNLNEYDAVIHFNISSKTSASHSNALAASEKFRGKVAVVDSLALSTGQGLLVLKACDLAAQGLSADEIYKQVNDLRPKVNTSFVPDSLDYLHKGGRCSLASLMGAKVLKLHPQIIMENGKLGAKKKYMGDMNRCIKNYINDLHTMYPEYDSTRCFVTHSSADPELVEMAKAQVKKLFAFDEVLETTTGSIVTSHCGRNTLGVLFITV